MSVNTEYNELKSLFNLNVTEYSTSAAYVVICKAVTQHTAIPSQILDFECFPDNNLDGPFPLWNVETK